MSNDILLTVDKPVESMIVVRKSKFICSIFPVSSVEQAEQHLEVIRKNIGMPRTMFMHIQ